MLHKKERSQQKEGTETQEQGSIVIETSSHQQLSETPSFLSILRETTGLVEIKLSEATLLCIERLVAPIANTETLRKAALAIINGCEDPAALSLILNRLTMVESQLAADEQESALKQRIDYAEQWIERVSQSILNKNTESGIKLLMLIGDYLGANGFSFKCIHHVMNSMPVIYGAHDTNYLYRDRSLPRTKVPEYIDLYDPVNETFCRLTQQLMEGYIAAISYMLEHSPKLRSSDKLFRAFADIGVCYDIYPGKHAITPTRNFETITALLYTGMAVDTPEPGRISPLLRAAMHNNARMLWFLLQQGIDNSVQDAAGQTALHVASINAYPLIVEMLLEVNPFLALINNKQGQTAAQVLQKAQQERRQRDPVLCFKQWFIDRMARCQAAFSRAEARIELISREEAADLPLRLNSYQTRKAPEQPEYFGDLVLQVVPGTLKEAINALDVLAVGNLLNEHSASDSSMVNSDALVRLMEVGCQRTRELMYYEDGHTSEARKHFWVPHSKQSVIVGLEERRAQIAKLLLRVQHPAQMLEKAMLSAVTFSRNASCVALLLEAWVASPREPGDTISTKFIQHLANKLFFIDERGRAHPQPSVDSISVDMIDLLSKYGAVFNGQHARQILKSLPTIDSDPNQCRDKQGLRHYAIEMYLTSKINQHLALLDALLSHNMQPDAVDESGISFLHHLAEHWHLYRPKGMNVFQLMISMLHSHGANMSIANTQHGATPLHKAITFNNGEMAQALLSEGADAISADQDGLTPLHAAVLLKNEGSVALLLAHNPGLMYLKDNKGKTPVDYMDELTSQSAKYEPGFFELDKQSGRWACFINAEKQLETRMNRGELLMAST